ncbi:putative Mg2+ transporter-C (MgtC) family protein [Caloranaerobacter azorensis DSM 13643]|uniref:Putative Mg2+ transporter-C (MgtC) family protein n=1 Tax=Caloranaerobacter azorensis DSM 13643 TaxID=1121264 RepID=A0A1M5VDY9_9FIRM|nr:putative Mg2+ transporter-C (MgtC) family protein [Caloranaerobacter azorensis DSM 13643]
MLTIKQIFIRLFLSILLSGLIGIERESIRRPAGFRTHILVCVGSTLVMLTGIYIVDLYNYKSNMDVTRLGAQVISGIGFLGAGTIIREGMSVKGLTTAAGLWAVACIGIAIGSGFYVAAILTALLVFVTLLAFTKFEKRIKMRRNYVYIRIVSVNQPGQLGKIGSITGKYGVSIKNIELESQDNNMIVITLLMQIPDKSVKLDLLNELTGIENILEVYEC